MMKISPSLASSDLLCLGKEIDFADRYFNNIHIDIEDGVAVSGITFGTKMAQRMCEYSNSEEKSIHLEVLRPLDYLEEVKACHGDVVFIQVAHLDNPVSVIQTYLQQGITVGISLNERDRERAELTDLLAMSRQVLVATAYHDDPKQEYQKTMEEFALSLANEKKHRVWIDGGITAAIYQRLKNTEIYAAVMGRAIYNDKELALHQFCEVQ